MPAVTKKEFKICKTSRFSSGELIEIKSRERRKPDSTHVRDGHVRDEGHVRDKKHVRDIFVYVGDTMLVTNLCS